MAMPDIEEKLGAANAEIKRLRQRLRRKEQECQDLQDECNFRAARSSDLEQQCNDRSAKAAELLEILGAKTPDAMGEKLLVKGLQNAEFTFQMRSLRQRLEDTEGDLEEMKKEQEKNDQMVSHITEKSAMLSLKLDEERSMRQRLTKERDSYKTMVLELSDVVRSLNCISVTYYAKGSDEASPPSAEQSQLLPVGNVKRKVEAIEQDRQLLLRENECLVEEIATKDKRIKALEGQYHFLNNTRLESGDAESLGKLSFRGRAGRRKRSSTIDAIAEVQVEAFPPAGSAEPVSIIHRSDDPSLSGANAHENAAHETAPNLSSSSWSSGDVSESSSFSSIEPPDVPLEKYEKLRHEHQVAMHSVSELEEQLREAKRAQFIEWNANEEDPNLQQKDVTKLNRKLHEATYVIEQANMNYENLKREYDASLVTHVSQYKQFKEDYESESAEHEQKYQVLDKKYRTALDRHTFECAQLKGANEEALESHKNTITGLKQQHAHTIRVWTEQYEHLKKEYDCLLATHTKTEEELREGHKAALLRVEAMEEELDQERQQHDQGTKDLFTRLHEERKAILEQHRKHEQELRDASNKFEEEAREHLKKANRYKQDLEERQELEDALRAVTAKAEKRLKGKYDQLKQAYDSSQADLKNSKEELTTIKRIAEQGISKEFRKLQEAHEEALAKISDLEFELLEPKTKHLVLDCSSQDEKSLRGETRNHLGENGGIKETKWTYKGKEAGEPLSSDSSMISYTEDEVQDNVDPKSTKKDVSFELPKTSKSAKSPSQQQTSEACAKVDTRRALQKIEKLENELLTANTFKGEEGELQEVISIADYVLHQHRLKRAHGSLVMRTHGGQNNDMGASEALPHTSIGWCDRLIHQRKLKFVIDALQSTFFEVTSTTQMGTKRTYQGKHGMRFDRLLHSRKQRLINAEVEEGFQDLPESSTNRQAVQLTDRNHEEELARMKIEVETSKREAIVAMARQEIREGDLHALLDQYTNLMGAYEAVVSEKGSQDTESSQSENMLRPRVPGRHNSQLENLMEISEEASKRTQPPGSFDDGSAETITLRSPIDPTRNNLGDDDKEKPLGIQDRSIFRKKAEIPGLLYVGHNLSHISTMSHSKTIDDGKDHTVFVAPATWKRKDGSTKALQYDVVDTSAKGKIAAIHMELNMTKEMAYEAHKEKEANGQYLREVIARYRELEKEHQVTVEKIKHLESSSKPQIELPKQRDLEGDLRAVIQQYRMLEKDYEGLLGWKRQKEADRAAFTKGGGNQNSISTISCSTSVSVDGTTNDMGVSPDMRDSQSVWTRGSRGGGGESGRHLPIGASSQEVDHPRQRDGQQEDRFIKGQISSIERDLEAAKKEAEEARKKQASRDGHLRDVIYQYKRLQSEYDALVKEFSPGAARQTSSSSSSLDDADDGSIASSGTNCNDNMNHDNHLIKLKNELEEARRLAEGAKMKQEERENHLRDVIYHYNKLQKEHTDLISNVEEIKKKLASERGSLPESNMTPSSSSSSSSRASISIRSSVSVERISSKLRGVSLLQAGMPPSKSEASSSKM